MQSYVLDLIESRKKNPPLLAFLKLLSYPFRAAIACRHFAYNRGWIKTHRVPACVISIGNIIAGGSGKTPLVHFLASELIKTKKVSVLSRGYRAHIENKKFSMRVTETSDPALCGDEPLLLAQKIPGIDLWVGKNRRLSAQEAIAMGSEVLILDDGMQHRSLGRDVEIVCVDAKDPFGKGNFLPRGLLRDHPNRLSQATLIATTGLKSEEEFQNLKSQLSPYTKAPLVGFSLDVDEPSQIQGKQVGIFCGIAKPERFKQTVQECGAAIVQELIALDHRPIPAQELKAFSEECERKGAECLLCTEKDWVKLLPSQNFSLPIIPLKVSLKIVFGEENWYYLIQKINDGKL